MLVNCRDISTIDYSIALSRYPDNPDQSVGPLRSSTSKDQISLSVPTGPRSRCWEWPAAKSALFSHAWKSSSERQRVMTRHWVRSSLGRRRSKDSKPSASSTFPAREAKRSANSSKRSRGTVIALILTMLMRRIVAGAAVPFVASPSYKGEIAKGAGGAASDLRGDAGRDPRGDRGEEQGGEADHREGED